MAPSIPDLLTTGSTGSGADESGEASDAGSSSGGTTGDPSEDSSASSESADASASTSCGDRCGDDPELRWLTVIDDIYGDGACVTVIPDGEGGLVASFQGVGFEAYGALMAIDDLGHLDAVGGGAEGGTFSGLWLRGPGLFDWASAAGDVGIADTTLQHLDGGPLAYDVAEIRAMAADDDALRYVARITPSLQCVVRTGADASEDTVPFACAQPFVREALHHDALGNAYYFEPSAYRVVRLDAAGLSWGGLDGRWNRFGTAGSVDADGHVWLVGTLGSGPDVAFGSFVARHDFELGPEPRWERTNEDDSVWTAVVTTAEGAIVLGHTGHGERLRGWGLTFDGDTSWTWEHEPEPRTYIDAIAVDETGDIVACGVRYEGEQTPVGEDAMYPTFMKLAW